MVTKRIKVATEVELAARAARGDTLGQLLDHVDARNHGFRGSSFSDEQNDELQLYCWMVYRRQSSGVLWGEPRDWGFLEKDIGG